VLPRREGEGGASRRGVAAAHRHAGLAPQGLRQAARTMAGQWLRASAPGAVATLGYTSVQKLPPALPEEQAHRPCHQMLHCNSCNDDPTRLTTPGLVSLSMMPSQTRLGDMGVITDIIFKTYNISKVTKSSMVARPSKLRTLIHFTI
jgi:hypothetical protein